VTLKQKTDENHTMKYEYREHQKAATKSV